MSKFLENKVQLLSEQNRHLWELVSILLARTGGPVTETDLEVVRAGGGGTGYFRRPGSDDGTGEGAADRLIAFLMARDAASLSGRGLIDETVLPRGPAREGTEEHSDIKSALSHREWAADPVRNHLAARAKRRLRKAIEACARSTFRALQSAVFGDQRKERLQ